MASIGTGKLRDVRKWYASGLSAREIGQLLRIDIDAVYYFMRHHGIVRRGASESNQMRFQRKPATYTLATNLNAKLRELKLLGVSLYWAEGAKRGRVVDFTNSDVAMCQIFMRFLREVCQIDERKLRGFIYCHQNQNPNELIAYWSKTLSIPKKQFTKPYIRLTGTSQKKYPERMTHGLVHIRYGDLKLLRQILTWKDESIHTWADM